MTRHYVLRGREAIPAPMETWARDFEKTERRIKQEYVGRFWISTVFLGLDHQWKDGGPPLIYETMVFAHSWEEEETHRYSTYDQALSGHVKIVKRLGKTVPWWEKVYFWIRRKL